MNYLESLAYIESLAPTTQKPCLERIAAFMHRHGDKQESFTSLHVAGTNGKGSTVAILDCVLRKSGYKVGRFTGPHLLRWNERFHVNGEPILDADFAHLLTQLRSLSEDFGKKFPEFGQLTWFELLTALAFFYFAECKVDIAVIEVGLGGRWDATNILKAPLATAITNIDLDHTQILGETVEQIAAEKAGIIKTGSPIVTAATGSALSVIKEVARASGSKLHHCMPPAVMTTTDFTKTKVESSIDFVVELEQLLSTSKHLSLVGDHQQTNALVAYGTLLASGLYNKMSGDPVRLITNAIKEVYWPGRLQLIPELNLLLDGAHNPAGAQALRNSLDKLFPNQRILLVLGCFENKDVARLVNALVRPNDQVFACEADTKRLAYPADRLAELAYNLGASAVACTNVPDALSQALSTRARGEIVLVTGSFAILRETLLHLGWTTVEHGRTQSNMDWGRIFDAVDAVSSSV